MGRDGFYAKVLAAVLEHPGHQEKWLREHIQSAAPLHGALADLKGDQKITKVNGRWYPYPESLKHD